MDNSLPDLYITECGAGLLLQGASRAAIELLGSLWSLMNGTTALVAPEDAEDAFERIDAAELRTRTL